MPFSLRTPAFLMLFSLLAYGQHSKFSSNLAAKDSNATLNVIVQFNTMPTSVQHEKVISRGGRLKGVLKSVKGGAYTLSASQLYSLAGEPDVVHISEDRVVGSLLDNTAVAVNASAAWQSGWDGTGVGVAVLDSGISDNPDLTTTSKSPSNRVIYSETFTGIQTKDQFGHGEHVAGIIAANGAGSGCSSCFRTLKGLAPNANLLDFRVLDHNGRGTDSSLIAAIERVIQLKSKYNIRVLNLSVGRPVFESYKVDPLCQAVEAAWKAGIVVVVAAGNNGRDNSFGNNGYGTITAPGNDPYVITVGAMKTNGTPQKDDDTVASYSSKGPTLIDYIVKPDFGCSRQPYRFFAGTGLNRSGKLSAECSAARFFAIGRKP